MCFMEDSENGCPLSLSVSPVPTTDGSRAIGHSGGYAREGGCVPYGPYLLIIDDVMMM